MGEIVVWCWFKLDRRCVRACGTSEIGQRNLEGVPPHSVRHRVRSTRVLCLCTKFQDKLRDVFFSLIV